MKDCRVQNSYFPFWLSPNSPELWIGHKAGSGFSKRWRKTHSDKPGNDHTTCLLWWMECESDIFLSIYFILPMMLNLDVNNYFWDQPNPKQLYAHGRDFLDFIIQGGKTHPKFGAHSGDSLYIRTWKKMILLFVLVCLCSHWEVHVFHCWRIPSLGLEPVSLVFQYRMKLSRNLLGLQHLTWNFWDIQSHEQQQQKNDCVSGLFVERQQLMDYSDRGLQSTLIIPLLIYMWIYYIVYIILYMYNDTKKLYPCNGHWYVREVQLCFWK